MGWRPTARYKRNIVVWANNNTRCRHQGKSPINIGVARRGHCGGVGNSHKNPKLAEHQKTNSTKLLFWTKQKPQIFISFSYEIHIVFGRFLCFFVRLRENGWTDLHEIFREGVEWSWDDLIKFWVNSGKRANFLLSPAITQRTGVNKSVSFARWQQGARFVVPRTTRCLNRAKFLYFPPRTPPGELIAAIQASGVPPPHDKFLATPMPINSTYMMAQKMNDNFTFVPILNRPISGGTDILW